MAMGPNRAGATVDEVQSPPAVDGDGSPDVEVRRQFPIQGGLQLTRATTAAALTLIVGAGAFLRMAKLTTLGFNTDEAVYAGQAASIAGNEVLRPFFPIFRAHPLLFQATVSVFYQSGTSDFVGRFVAALFGLGTVLLTYLVGRHLYSRGVGLAAAAVLALMPYHVVVSRQVLLDGPMVFFATLTLYLMARYASSGRTVWLYAASAALGLTFLAKETGVILLGAIFAFIALTPSLTVRVRQLALSFTILVVCMLPYPVALASAQRSSTGGAFLAYQLFRRPNHPLGFYPTVVPPAMGLLVLAAAAGGLWLLRRQHSWRENLLVLWIAVTVIFFEAYPVKGFQYLLPAAPAVAVLAGRALGAWPTVGRLGGRRWTGSLRLGLILVVCASLAVASWQRIDPSPGRTFLAGSGGVAGAREAGLWVRSHVPAEAQMLAIGPSMANIIQWYGNRKTFGLSVSPNPLRRNPVYDPVINPDLAIRSNKMQYLIWDSYSAERSPFFGDTLLRYAERYHGNVVHTESVETRTAEGKVASVPVIVIYEVRP